MAFFICCLANCFVMLVILMFVLFELGSFRVLLDAAQSDINSLSKSLSELQRAHPFIEEGKDSEDTK
jgi:hypothetical protein